MLDVLLESRAPRTRRTGGVAASALIHTGIIAAAVAVTMSQPREVTARPTEVLTRIYTPTRPDVARPVVERRRVVQEPAGPVAPRIPTFDDVSTPILPGPTTVDLDQTFALHERGSAAGPGVDTGAPFGGGLVSTGGVFEAAEVDRAPRILGRPESPVYPTALRQSGQSGRVVIQFAIDTTGRAELATFRVLDASDPLFVEPVRTVLGRYRFSPGEVGGRKVRTLVQLPFDFSLIR